MRIAFSEYDFNIKKEGEQSQVWDVIRKRYVALTPEEWVRQHWIRYLIEKKFPRSLIAVEMSLKLNTLAKRCDIVVYGRNGQPQLIIECKSANVLITQKVFEQVARYNLSLKVKYLVVSNGKQSYCCEINHAQGSYTFLESLPEPVLFK